MNKTIKKPSINLKLTESLKEKIKGKADLKKQTVSKFIRELLSNYLDGSLCKGEIHTNAKKDFINSTEFLKLIVWMYSIKRSKTFKETPDTLENHIKTLKKMEQHLPKDLVLEFDKVLLDLIRVTNEMSVYSKVYKFANGSSSSPEFKFELLEKYIHEYEKSIKVPPLSAFKTAKIK